MATGQIPVNPDDLPIDAIEIDESEVLTCSFKGGAIANKLSQKGVMFCMLQFESVEGPYEGLTINLNYLPVPYHAESDSKIDKVKAHQASWQFGRFARAFGIKGDFLKPEHLGDAAAVAEWNETLKQNAGNIGKLTIRNQEFPEGSGRKRAGVSDFVL